MPKTPLHPLQLEPALHERVWGGRQLETRLGKKLPPGRPIGESWEIFWKNPVANGPFKGQTLGDLIQQYPQEMMGTPNADPEFPLLIKFLDSQDWLSVQVHPDNQLAMELEGQPRGKTECWYVIDAKPGAQLIYGFAEDIDAEGFRQTIEAGRTRDVLQYVDVAPGDFLYLPAGTIHALGPGMLIYELQQTSDTTYRVYDWDRVGLDGKPRDLHIEKSIRCIHYDAKPQAKVDYRSNAVDSNDSQTASLVDGPYFELSHIMLKHMPHSSYTINYTENENDPRSYPHTLTVIRGSLTLHSMEAQQFEPLTVSLGQSIFLPALIGRYEVRTPDEAEFLLASPVYS